MMLGAPKEVTPADVEKRISFFSLQAKENRTHIWYVEVMGGQPPRDFKRLATDPELAVLWYGSIIPAIWRPLLFWVPSHGGLLKIFNAKKLKTVFSEFAATSMMAWYYVDNALEERLMKSVQRGLAPNDIIALVSGDPHHIIYVCDLDNPGALRGAYEWLFTGLAVTDLQ